MQSTTIAVDLAKNVFQVGVSHRPGQVAESHRLSRSQFLRFLAERQPALVLMEACGTAHFWGRKAQEFGHQVLLLPPGHVRPYVRRNKTDQTDTKGLLEAHRNEDIHPVPLKSVLQQTLAGLHRLRSAWLADRTARINLVRGLLRELGFALPLGARHVVVRAWAVLDAPDSELPAPLCLTLGAALREIRDFEARIAEVEKQLRALAAEMPVVKRLLSIPGIGLLTATALVAFIGDVQRFASCRRFASFLGITPREHSSGLKRRLGRISKCGDVYLRMLLIHGARSVLWAARRAQQPDRLRAWALHVQATRGHNKAAVALANKMARIVWAVWRRESSYQSQPAV